jgi:serine/threonine-protein kinase
VIEPGTRFLDRYQIVRSLGRGTYGEVWLATNEDGATFAIKLQREEAWGATVRQDFAREGARAITLFHPSLVRVFDFGVTDDRAYIVMEHVDGLTLDEELRRRRQEADPLPLSLVRRWAAQLCGAMDALHAAALVHRDLKPLNIMVFGADPQLKVLDLGLVHDASVSAEELTTLGRVKGTTAYMSPEQALGQRVGPSSDVFALTTIVFELLTGVRPWLLNTNEEPLLVGQRVPAGTNDAARVLRRISQGPRPRPSQAGRELPAAIDALFEAGWASEPGDRPLPTQAWAARLDAALAGLPAQRSAWTKIERPERSSVARARAPVADDAGSDTPVAAEEPMVAPKIEDTSPSHTVALVALPTQLAEATVLSGSRGSRWRIGIALGVSALAASALLGLWSLASSPRPGPPEEAAPPAAKETPSPIAVVALPIARATPAARPPVEPDATPSAVRTASAALSGERVPTPRRPTSEPRGKARPPPGPPPIADAARALRLRLDRGEPIEDIARAAQRLATRLPPAERQALDRWTQSAIELGDPRPLALALDALSRAK